MYTVFRIVSLYVSVSQTNREVGIRSFRSRCIHFAKTAYVSLVQQVDVTVGLIQFVCQFLVFLAHCSSIFSRQVFVDCFYSRILDESVEVLFISEDTVVVEGIYVGIVITLKCILNSLIEIRQCFRRYFFGIKWQ